MMQSNPDYNIYVKYAQVREFTPTTFGSVGQTMVPHGNDHERLVQKMPMTDFDANFGCYFIRSRYMKKNKINVTFIGDFATQVMKSYDET